MTLSHGGTPQERRRYTYKGKSRTVAAVTKKNKKNIPTELDNNQLPEKHVSNNIPRTKHSHSNRTDGNQQPENTEAITIDRTQTTKHKQSRVRTPCSVCGSPPLSPLGTKGRRQRRPCLRGKPTPHHRSAGPCPAASGLPTTVVPKSTTEAAIVERGGMPVGKVG